MIKAIIKDYHSILRKSEQYILLALFFTIPLSPKLTTVLIIIYSLVSLLTFERKYFRNIWFRKPVSLLMLVYLILIVGLSYSSDITLGFSKVQTQLSLLVFPLFLGGKNLLKEQKEQYFLSFILGVVFTSLLCFGNSFYRYYETGDHYVLDEFSRKINIFFYVEFSDFLDLHPTYFSIYIGLSLFYLLSYYHNDRKYGLIIKWTLMIFLFVTFIFTSSKAGIFSFLIASCTYFIYSLIRRPNKYTISLLSTLILGVSFIFLINPLMYQRTEQLVSSFDKVWMKQEQTNESSSIRFGLWKLSTQVIKNSPLYGYGTGSVVRSLNENCIALFSFSICEGLRNKNSHNQYLNFLVSNGFLILIPFLLALFLGLVKALNNKDQIFFFFIVFMGLNFVFESILERERGVVFFSAFFILFLVCQNSQKELKNV
ncbi:O-antigen ligase family protein [Maribacter sp. BPC-D8]|uniref:O-antigen ligase family protein n=1 Tax=Maribacter sp. BPC-D8 TaxID=3053613 RepID=UPI002B48133A|nr:O-antigen ligase family protein [Maribacter sp. BPC-D8]WRI28714.1 O-antigen ligase family protein [Maribacter sp. BPC-D8]